jgi:hypothetical protein
MRVENADFARKKAKKQSAVNRDQMEDDENYRITQEYFMTKERDMALSKNGIKTVNKKLLMGDNERRVTKQNPVEDKVLEKDNRHQDSQAKYMIGHYKHERSNLLDKYMEIDLELKEIKKKKILEIEYELKELEKKKRHELNMKFNETLKSKFAELNDPDSDWAIASNDNKSRLLEVEKELKEYRKELEKKLSEELNEFEKKKKEEFTRSFNVSKFQKVSYLHLNENREKKCTSSLLERTGAKSAPIPRKYLSFEEFQSQQATLIEALAKYYAIDYKDIPECQRLHTPTKFQSFADSLQDRIYEQRHKYYPDSFNKKKVKANITVGIGELIQSPGNTEILVFYLYF